MKTKKLPMRQCLGCKEMKLKKELIRVVRSPEGEISLDETGKKSGRGAYICPSADCLRKAIKMKAFDKCFDSVPDEIYLSLERQLNG